MERKAFIKRKTAETEISLNLNIDGSGENNISTGVGFLNHMLNLFARHGLIDLEVMAHGDLDVDAHHTVEDVGIVLGQALKEALGDKKSIRRYGTSFVPMDEALAMTAIDIGGRPYLVFDCSFTADKVGEMDTELVEEFFRAISLNSGMNIHIKAFYGRNNHHMAEAIFKSFGRALDEACRLDARIEGVMSTKGVI
jgi:imidazoleglycerol-phosphate dehydratase